MDNQAIGWGEAVGIYHDRPEYVYHEYVCRECEKKKECTPNALPAPPVKLPEPVPRCPVKKNVRKKLPVTTRTHEYYERKSTNVCVVLWAIATILLLVLSTLALMVHCLWFFEISISAMLIVWLGVPVWYVARDD